MTLEDQEATNPPEDPALVTELTMRDDSRVWIRPIRLTDRDEIAQGMAHLSARSRYMRFHSAVAELSESQLDYLTDVDHEDHEALVALDPDLPGTPGVGVARYIRLHEDPHIAEAAVTVSDDHQGRGIGTALIGLLQIHARQRGIRTFRNYVLAENKAMLAIFRELDGTFVSEGASLYRVDVPIPESIEDLPDTPAGRWVASLAQSDAPSPEIDWAFPLLWAIRQLPGLTKPMTAPVRAVKGLVEAFLADFRPAIDPGADAFGEGQTGEDQTDDEQTDDDQSGDDQSGDAIAGEVN